MVFHSTFDPVDPVDLPIHDAVLGRAAEYGDIPAVVDGVTGTALSYAQLADLVRRFAGGLARAGLRPGDVLALHSPNSALYPAVFYGATRAGATVTTVHPLATADEFAKQLRDSGARWIVTVSQLLPTAREAAAKAGGISEVYLCDTGDAPSVQTVTGWDEPAPDLTVDPARDVAVLPYSSGTTGTPKGVMLTHRNIATNLAQLDAVMPSEPGHRILAVLPFFHIYGLTALMNGPLRRGSTVVVLPRFDLEQFLGAIESYRVQGLYVAPPIVLALAKHPVVDSYDLGSLEYVLCAAAPLDAGLASVCAQRLGLPPVLQAYGMTELSPGTHVVPRGATDFPPGAVGRLLPSTEMRLVSLDGAGRDLGAGEDGEVLIRGPQVMKGYLGRPGDTDAMIDDDGWLHTGDVGRVDEDGWLFVVDRVKELIKYHGYQVAPAELEAVLLTEPRIADAAVIGVYDAEGNEIPKAYVVPREGSGLAPDDVIEYVAGRVAPYKKVRRVEFTDAIPRAVSGKILRRELRAREGQ